MVNQFYSEGRQEEGKHKLYIHKFHFFHQPRHHGIVILPMHLHWVREAGAHAGGVALRSGSLSYVKSLI